MYAHSFHSVAGFLFKIGVCINAMHVLVTYKVHGMHACKDSISGCCRRGLLCNASSKKVTSTSHGCYSRVACVQVRTM